MNYRNLGKSGLKVSELSIGSWQNFGLLPQREVNKIINTGIENGINFFDTADEYNDGLAEKMLGVALQDINREDYMIASKVYYPVGTGGANNRGLSRKHIISQIDHSLNRLKVEYLDIYYMHRFDTNTPLEETLLTMNNLINQGKILYLGISQWTVEQLEKAFEIIEAKNLEKIIVNQPYYNLLQRNIEDEIVPKMHDMGVGQVVFSPLAEGVLTGKYLNNIPEASRAQHQKWSLTDSLTDPYSGDPMKALLGWQLMTGKVHKRVNQLKDISDQLGITLSQLSLAWVLNNKNVSSVIMGVRNVEQLKENLVASNVRLSNAVLEEINRITMDEEMHNNNVERIQSTSNAGSYR